MKNFQQAYDSHLKQLNEVGGGGFNPVGSPEGATWAGGGETSDEVTEDDINSRIEEIGTQIRTLDEWIANVREFGDADNETVWDDINNLQQAINGFVMEYNVEESVHGNEDFETDKARDTAGVTPFSNVEPDGT